MVVESPHYRARSAPGMPGSPLAARETGASSRRNRRARSAFQATMRPQNQRASAHNASPGSAAASKVFSLFQTRCCVAKLANAAEPLTLVGQQRGHASWPVRTAVLARRAGLRARRAAVPRRARARAPSPGSGPGDQPGSPGRRTAPTLSSRSSCASDQSQAASRLPRSGVISGIAPLRRKNCSHNAASKVW